jgi:hypothetical protein
MNKVFPLSRRTKLSAGLLFGLMTAAVSSALAVTIDGNGITRGEKFAPFQSHRRWLSTPVASLDDGRLVTLVDNGVVFSSDDMATWFGTLPILTSDMKSNHPGSSPSGSGTLYIHSSGKMVVAWRDPRHPDALEDYWNRELDGPVEGASGDVWASSSSDRSPLLGMLYLELVI